MLQLSKHYSSRTLFLALLVVIFLVLDLTMLWLNYRITQELSEDSLVINLAGRQRMLSQRMSKAVFQIDEASLESEQNQQLTRQYLDVFALFSNTLKSFELGGSVLDAEMKHQKIDAIDLPEALPIMSRADQLIAPLLQINQRIASQGLEPDSLYRLRDLLAQNNEKLLTLMNDLTVRVEKNSQRQAEQLRGIQTLTFILALINFAYIINLFRSINRRSSELIETLSELLQGTNASLVVFSDDGRVELFNRSARQLFGYTESEFRQLSRADMFVYENETVLGRKAGGHDFEVELHECEINRGGRQLTIATVVDISHHLKLHNCLKTSINNQE